MSVTRCEYLQGKENEHLRPNTSMVVDSVDAESLKCCQYYEKSRPAVVERERQVDENLIRDARGFVVLLHNVVNVLPLRVST